MRLAVFVDQVFWREGERLSTNESYVLFLTSLAEHADEIVLIGREAAEPGQAPYALDSDRVSLLPVPYYPSLHELWKTDPRLYGRVLREVSRQASEWDALLVSGPHPIGQLIARACIRRKIPVGLIVRQNLIEQMSAYRAPKRYVAMAAAALLEWDFRRLARKRTVFAVGAEMTDAYGRATGKVHNHFPCLVDEKQFRSFAAMSPGQDPARLLCVCRLAPEKGHEYLFQAVLQLKQQGLPCQLDIVGTGLLESALKQRAAQLGIASQVMFHGYVAYGPPLFELYQRAGIMVLASTTEGFPQVINESLSIGLPTVVTAVGGLPAFLTHGETALLVPPRDPSALATAIAELIRDGALRDRLRRNGRALMAENTLEANKNRVMKAIRDELIGAPAQVSLRAG